MNKLSKIFLVITLISALGGCMGSQKTSLSQERDFTSNLEELRELSAKQDSEVEYLISISGEKQYKEPALKLLQEKLDAGMSPNEFVIEGRAPVLMAAIISARPAIVKMLVEYGADVNLATSDGIRPLEMANFLIKNNIMGFSRTYKEISDYLISQGAEGAIFGSVSKEG